MEQEYETLLELLGTFVTGREPAIRHDTDWTRLVRLAAVHQVSGISGYMVMKYPICPDEQIKTKLRKECMRTVARYTQRQARLNSLCQSLTEAEIPHILMKGAVVRDYYPVPELRTYGDVDLVIRPEDRERCHRLMLDQGFAAKVDWGPVCSYVRGMEFYEIHTEIMEVNVGENADHREYFRQMWQHVTPRTGSTMEFTPEFHLLYLLVHIAKHIRGAGAGARMYLDLAAFMLHFPDGLDWEWICRELRALKLYRFASVAMSAVREWFGVTCPMELEPVAPDVLIRFRAFTMEAGLFGYYERERGLNTLKHSGETKTSSRLMLLLRRVFPPAEQIQARYTYLQDKPWLLPVAWIHRAVKTRKTAGLHLHEAQVILSADEEEVLRLQNLCREIGL